MDNKNFKKGTIIKGKDLKGMTLCKILSEDMNMRGFQYQLGLNEDTKPLGIKKRCEEGLHFCHIQDVCNYIDHGKMLAIVEIPDDEDVYVGKNKYRTHRLIIQEMFRLDIISTWKFLCENGADIAADDNYALTYAKKYGHLDVVKYFKEIM